MVFGMRGSHFFVFGCWTFHFTWGVFAMFFWRYERIAYCPLHAPSNHEDMAPMPSHPHRHICCLLAPPSPLIELVHRPPPLVGSVFFWAHKHALPTTLLSVAIIYRSVYWRGEGLLACWNATFFFKKNQTEPRLHFSFRS